MEKEKQVLARDRPGPLKRVLLHIGGIALIVLGIVGLFLPILQGILMIVAGIGLLSMGNERVRRWIEELAGKYPRQAAYFRKARRKLRAMKRGASKARTGDSEEGADNGR